MALFLLLLTGEQVHEEALVVEVASLDRGEVLACFRAVVDAVRVLVHLLF